jgi:hypothetical protein
MDFNSLTTGSILGFQPWFAYLILIVGIGGLGWWYIKRAKKGQSSQQQKESIYCTWSLHTSKKVHYWCSVIENEVGLSPEERKRLEKIAKAHGHKDDIEKWYKGDLAKLNPLSIPVDIDGGKYFVGSEFIFEDDHPLDGNKPENQRRRIKTCDFMAGIPIPIIGVNLAKWTPDMLEEYASSLVGAASDIATLQILNAKDHGFLDNLSKVAQAMAQFSQVKLAAFAAAGGAAIAIVLGWLVMNKVDTLISLFMPKAGG